MVLSVRCFEGICASIFSVVKLVKRGERNGTHADSDRMKERRRRRGENRVEKGGSRKKRKVITSRVR
jgi:hypothetical protein